MSVAEGRVLADVVSAFVRSIRAMGYYDESHPVFEASSREAHAALLEAFRFLPVVTLGCGGHHLLIDEQGTALRDPPAVDLARRMFENAVVAVRLWPEVQVEDLGDLMHVLAEREDRVRAAGGVAAVLTRRGTIGVEVLEVDIEGLFSGRLGDLGGMTSDDPVVEHAVRAILRFRDEESQAGGEALQISLSQVASPESLGGFLDELMAQAEPGVVTDAASGGPMTGDDLADFASQAFLRSVESSHLSGGSPTEQIARSAELLSSALVRLSPDARFALLRKLAGAESLGDDQTRAVRDLGGHLDDREVTAAIAAALFDQQGDPATVRSIGNLIRRIRPVEAERQRLLAAVDDDMSRRGRPIDGVLWQEMQSRAFEDGALGLLEMSLAQTRDVLTDYARARREGRLAAVAGQDVLHTVDRNVVDYWTTFALVDLLQHAGRLGTGALEACRQQLDRLEESGATDECMTLLQAMMQRTDVEEEPELSGILLELLEGPRGARWSVRLLQHESRPSQMMGEILLAALDRPGDKAFKDAMIDRLARFDDETLARLVGRLGRRLSPFQAQSLVLAALRRSAQLGLRAARACLRNPNYRVREVVIKALVARPDPQIVSLLAHLAGWKGERYTKALLAVDAADSRGLVHRMQLNAIGALGLTHSSVAARPLTDILVRSRMFSDREQDELRVAAAQALRTNATPEAMQALTEASRHKKRAIRDVVTRVLGRRGRP